MELTTTQLIVTLIFSTFVGISTGYLANMRGREPIIWGLVGFFFGLFGLIALMLFPNLSKKEQEKAIELVVEPVVPEQQLKEWYYLEGAEQKGPIEYSTLKDLWGEKTISSTTYVWSEGMEEWKTVQECQLFTS